MRVGFGYDAHRLVDERPLILGGVHVPYSKGLLGHSDADVLTHAICDAMLGAAAEGDLGKHFPDSDQKYKGISSLELLRHVVNLLEAKGFILSNLDATIVCQQPKLAPYIGKMAGHIADIASVPPSDVNIKATTTEGMGFTGSGEGISAYCVVMIKKRAG